MNEIGNKNVIALVGRQGVYPVQYDSWTITNERQFRGVSLDFIIWLKPPTEEQLKTSIPCLSSRQGKVINHFDKS